MSFSSERKEQQMLEADIGAEGHNISRVSERIMARDPGRQTAEIHISVALINRVNALGTAEIIRVE